jgi:mevalonate pyrophosphate decarboxylase
MYEGNRKGLTRPSGINSSFYKYEDEPTERENANSETQDIFPALQKYKEEHNSANLQKLCVEISEFCQSVYASTRNEAERKIYRAMIEKLNKKN